MARFGRVATAMVTPFTDDGSLDVDGAAALARWLQDEGNEGLIVAGTTGESPTLTDAEKLTLWETVADAVTIPVVAGSGTNDTAHSVHLTAEASKLGVAGILALCPYYNRPSQAGIEAHLRAVAEATDLPVIVYDIPIRTGRKIATALLARLAHEVDNIVAVKDAAANPAETARLVAAAPAGYEVYSGDDSFTLPLLAIGAVGVVGVATHWCARDMVELFDRWEAGDPAGARAVNDRLLESWAYETGDECPNPGPAKAMLRYLGLPAGRCRPPMDADPPWLADAAADVHRNLLAARG